MTKALFLKSLRFRISDLPAAEVDERISFYNEMISDRMEEGLDEDEAVAAIGSIEIIAAQIKQDYRQIPSSEEQIAPTAVRPLGTSTQGYARAYLVSKKNSLKAWEIVLLALGSPI